jgi:hypothetical protein
MNDSAQFSRNKQEHNVHMHEAPGRIIAIYGPAVLPWLVALLGVETKRLKVRGIPFEY